MSELLQTGWQVFLGVGGTASIVMAIQALYKVRADKRALDTSTGKTSAETVTELSGAMVTILTSAPGEIARLAERLKQADADIEKLTVKVREQSNEIEALTRQLEMRAREAMALKAEMEHLSVQLTAARLELAKARNDHGKGH